MHACMHACTYVCMYVCMYVCTYVRMYVCMYMYHFTDLSYCLVFYSTLFYSILFYSVLCYSILFYSILFYSIHSFCIGLYFTRLYSIGWCNTMISYYTTLYESTHGEADVNCTFLPTEPASFFPGRFFKDAPLNSKWLSCC